MHFFATFVKIFLETLRLDAFSHILPMDIDLLSKMVKELILEKDEVTLPGVGTFVAELVPSVFSDRGYTINPPYKRLTFRQMKKEGDESLAEFYAASNNIDLDTARRIINDFLRDLKDILTTRKSVPFPGLGKLRATKENYFFFVADEDLDIYPEGFGLEPVSLKTHETSISEVSETMASLRSILNPEEMPQTLVADAALDNAQSAAGDPAQDESQSDSGAVAVENEDSAEESMEPENVSDSGEEMTPEGTAGEEIVDEEASGEESEGAAVSGSADMDEIPQMTVEDNKIELQAEANESAGATAGDIKTDSEPAAEIETATDGLISGSEPESANELASGNEHAAENESGKNENGGSRTMNILKWSIITLIILAALALIVFLVLARVAPDFIDSILYTPEELELLGH